MDEEAYEVVAEEYRNLICDLFKYLMDKIDYTRNELGVARRKLDDLKTKDDIRRMEEVMKKT